MGKLIFIRIACESTFLYTTYAVRRAKYFLAYVCTIQRVDHISGAERVSVCFGNRVFVEREFQRLIPEEDGKTVIACVATVEKELEATAVRSKVQ